MPPPPPSPPPTTPTHRPSLTGGISIKTTPVTNAVQPRLVSDVKPLEQADLETYWEEAAQTLGLRELLAGGKPRLGEKPGLIEVDAQSVAFHDEFKPHRTEVMEFLREKTGMRMLDCKVNQMFVTREELIYSPDNKFKAMLEANPAMLEMRKLFPQIDY